MTERELEAACAEMRQALEATQWGGDRDEPFCPVCEWMQRYGHEPGCIVSNALAADAGRAHLEADAHREALLKSAAIIITRDKSSHGLYCRDNMQTGRPCVCGWADHEEWVAKARAGGLLPEEEKDV